MDDQPHTIVPPKKPPKERPLSGSQLRVLHNIACGYAPDLHVRGLAAHGAFPQTLTSLESRCLIRGRFGTPELTLKGVKQHRALCCTQGLTEDDAIIHQVERQLDGKSTQHLNVQHSDLERLSIDSPFRVRCPACLVGVLLVARDQKTMKLLRIDTCHRCAQTFVYMDKEIGGETLQGDDGVEE